MKESALENISRTLLHMHGEVTAMSILAAVYVAAEHWDDKATSQFGTVAMDMVKNFVEENEVLNG